MDFAGDPGGTLIHELPAIALLLDADWSIRYANARLHTMLGHSPAQVSGQRLQDLVHPEDREAVAAAASATRPAPPGRAGPVSCRLRHADGSWCVMDLRFSGDGEMLAALAISREVRASGPESLSRIAHDLNNHLSTVLGFAELLLADLPEGDPYREDLAEIHKAGRSALTITGRLATLLGSRDGS